MAVVDGRESEGKGKPGTPGSPAHPLGKKKNSPLTPPPKKTGHGSPARPLIFFRLARAGGGDPVTPYAPLSRCARIGAAEQRTRHDEWQKAWAGGCVRNTIFVAVDAVDAAGRTSVNLTPNPHHWDAGNACACTLACILCGVIKSGGRAGGARRGENRVCTGRPLACSLTKKKKKKLALPPSG